MAWQMQSCMRLRLHRKPTMGFRLGQWPLTPNGPELSSSRLLKLHVKYFATLIVTIKIENKKSNKNQLWGFKWPDDLWPWVTSSRPRSMSHNLYAKHLECRERYNVGENGSQKFKNGDNEVNRSRTGNHQGAIDWQHDLWSWTNLNWPSSRTSKLHVKYFNNDDRYSVAVTISRIGNHTRLSIGNTTFDFGWP